MGLLDRITRIVRASLTSMIDQAEDPEQVLVQTLTEMQGDLIQIRQGVAQAIATQKRTERQYEHAQGNAQEYYNRAQLALQKGDEIAAKEALARRQTYLETAQIMARQLSQQQTVVAKLKDNMRVLDRRLAEAKIKKDMYVARARSAQASERLHDLLGRVGSGGTTPAFEKMEEKILSLEARSDAIAELNQLSTSDPLAEKFATLEGQSSDRNATIEGELAAMKAQLQSPNLPPLPPANER